MQFCRAAIAVAMIVAASACAGTAPDVSGSQAQSESWDEPPETQQPAAAVPNNNSNSNATTTPPPAGGSEPPPGGGQLCEACASDDACGGSEDRCLNYPEGSFCGSSCSEGCPVDYSCRRVRTLSGKRAEQCVHEGDTCSGGPLGSGTQDAGQPEQPAPTTPEADGGIDASPTTPSGPCASWSEWTCQDDDPVFLCRASCSGKELVCLNTGDCICGVGVGPCGRFTVSASGCDTCEEALLGGCCN